MQPLLVIMAAGMGSRYGGSKQIDPISKEGDICSMRIGPVFEESYLLLKRILKKHFVNMWVNGPERCTKLILSIKN